MRATGILWPTLLAATLSGCIGTAPSVATRIVDPAEIELVAPELKFVGIRDVVVKGDHIWVLDVEPPFVSGISLTDGSVVQFGRSGHGPGELVAPAALQVVGDGQPQVLVWDLAQDRASVFDRHGELLRSTPITNHEVGWSRDDIDAITYADPRRIRALGDGTVAAYFPHFVRHGSDVLTGTLRSANPSLDPTPSDIVRFADLAARDADDMKQFGEIVLWDACDAAVVVWDPRERRAEWMDMAGRAQASVPLTAADRPVEMADIERYLAAMSRLEMGPGHHLASTDLHAIARATRDRFATHAPMVTDVRCQSSRVAWLRGFDTGLDPVGRGSTWTRVDQQGRVGEIRFPTTFHGMAFTASHVYGADEDPSGFQRLARWTVTSSGD